MGGLKTVFAVFMGRSRLRGQRKSDASTERGEEERVVSIICNLLTVSRALSILLPRKTAMIVLLKDCMPTLQNAFLPYCSVCFASAVHIEYKVQSCV